MGTYSRICTKKVDLMSSNPAFGLNALGGSISLTTKKGLDYKNEELYLNNTVKVGSYAYHSETFEFGTGTEDTGLYTSLEKQVMGDGETIVKEKLQDFIVTLNMKKKIIILIFLFWEEILT